MEAKSRRLRGLPTLKEKNSTKQDQDKRKSLQTLQPSADSISVLVGVTGPVTKDKGEKGQIKHKGKDFFRKNTLKENCERSLSNSQCVLKENSPMRLRHSNRNTSTKNAGPKKNKKLVTNSSELDLHSDIPVAPKQDNSTLSKWITKKQVTKLKNSAKIEQNTTENVKLVGSVSSLEKVESPGSSEVFEGEKSIINDIKKRKSTEESHIDENSNVSKKTKTGNSVSSNELCRKFSISPEVYSLLINDEIPDAYWKELAEQRRIALDSSLCENEMLHEQVEVLEARLQKLEKENEELIAVAKGHTKIMCKDTAPFSEKILTNTYRVNTENNQFLLKDDSPMKLRHSNRKTIKDVGPKTLRNKKHAETSNKQLPKDICSASKEKSLALDEVAAAKPVIISNYSNNENLHTATGNVELLPGLAPNSEKDESSAILSKILDRSERTIDNEYRSDADWKILAEKTLHENEMLQDQIEVLETENAHLRDIAKGAEELAVTVKGMLEGP